MKNDDSELIQRTLEGDQHAFAQLVEKYQEQVHTLAWQKIGDFHIAQEITQDVFITAYQKFSSFTHYRQFAGWLYVVTNRKCIAWHRKKKIETQSFDETNPVELEEAYYSEYIAQQREEAEKEKRRTIVHKLLSKLQESDRTVMSLYYLAEMSCEEISEFLGVAPNTVRSRLHRARNRLKKEEAVIQENLSSFQLPTQMTENITGSKPLVPLAVSAASAIIVFLLIGFGAQNLIRFQMPFSLTAQSERTVEIVDARLVLESPAKPAIINQVGRSDVLSNNDGTGQKPVTPLFAAAQSDDTERTNFKGTWRQTNGPYGGKITTLYKTTHGVLLAGTEGAGIFRSTDNGNNWTPVNTGLNNEGRFMDVTAFAEKGNKIYAGRWEALYFSTDIGNTWQPVSAIQGPGWISGIVIHDDHIYVSTEGRGVWQSNDGDSWAQINDGLGITVHDMLLHNDLLTVMEVFRLSRHGTMLVATTRKGLFRRTGNEDSWTLTNPVVVKHSGRVESENNSQDKPGLNPSPEQHSSSDLRVESFASMKHLLFVSGNIGKKSGIFRSNDAGDSWMLITPEKVKAEGDDVQTIAVQGGRLYAGTYDGLVYLSEDMGDSWISINDGVMHGGVLSLLPINDNTVFIGTSKNGVFRTTDAGNSWEECNTGIINTSVTKLEVIGDKLYTVVGKKIVYSADGGDTWLPVNDPSMQSKFGSPTICVSDGELYIAAYFGDDKYIPPFSGREGDSVYRLNRKNNTLVKLFTDMDLYGIVSMDVVGNTFYMGTWKSGVFQWEQKTGLTKLGLVHHNIWLLSANSENVIVVAGHRGTVDNEIYRFKENRWEPIHTAEMIDGGLTDLKWVGSTLYATFWENGVFRSMDGGDTWTSINDGLDETSATSIGTNGTEVYVSTSTGVFKWIEEKQHWKSIGSHTQQVSSLVVVDGFLYAGTFNSGVYKIRIEQ
ncbi:sigma-70 family RNA polymerase sigma factor [Candidatus Poribacteria bacterium]|nr:sigma-70 family RNA polymerase sigma factor [Candidatus Poribacteria bacterium]